MRNFPLYLGLYLLTLLASCTGTTGEDNNAGGSNTDNSTFTLGGSISGINGAIQLSTNGVTLTTSINGSFSFPANFTNGSNYNVQVQPPTNHTCNITNGSGIVAGTNITDIAVTCTLNLSSISGNITSTVLTVVDSDINDPGARANVSNNLTTSAQVINNLSTVQGFASAVGTGRTGDRFANVADNNDYYLANLQQSQTITLQSVDFSGADTFQGDLDLFLLDAAGTMIAQGSPGTEFKNVTVPADGTYFILITAASGISKYTLRLNSANVLALTTNLSSGQSVDFVPNELIVKFRQNLSFSAFTAANSHLTLSHHDRSRASLARMTAEAASQKLFGTASSTTTRATPVFLDELKRINVKSYEKILTLREIKRLNARADIEYAEPNYIYHAQRVPDDNFYNLQWHYPAINLPQAWDITTGTPSSGDVIVAIIDTGVFLAHSDLAGKLTPGYDFISDATNANDGDGIDSNPDDPGDGSTNGSSSWHGTHVAGTVAANSNNSTGVAGVSWGAKLMPLRVLGAQGGSTFDIAQAMRYASGLSNDSNTLPAQKADIINMSLGGPGATQAMQNAVNAARAAGVIVIAAAGNDSSSTLFYPASYDGVVSVSATDFAGNLAPYSNFGSRIDVAAPGGDQSANLNNDNFGDGILSTLVDDSSGTRTSSFVFYQGTSMASPHIAGVAALMRAVYPGLTPAEFDNALISGALTNEAGASGRDDIFGYGIIDALKAVQEAQRLANGGTAPPPPALISATPSSLVLGLLSNAQLTISNQSVTAASISSFSDNANWLSVAENTVDANKLGTYDITIDRTGLSDSIYNATITFNLSTGSTLTVQVSMLVGNVSTTGDIGTAYILLIDTTDSRVINTTSPVDLGGGNYTYRFNSVPNGTYQIIGGSDIDNDLIVCQTGENCGGFPVVNALQDILVLSADVTNLDFNIDIVSTVASGSLIAQGALSGILLNKETVQQPVKSLDTNKN
ncbi:MAG TPA: peptidase S8 [Gammaproteobacteria bacterium]|nr:peptidase S8 [Gammaproteobacteria bacterium]